MKSFWSYIKNDKFCIGCTGRTVYLYDENQKEIKKFKDIQYAYTPMFCPNNKMFVVKSTAGMIAIYSLETISLIKKFRFSEVDGAQDDGFCFSQDGKYFYNIERHIDSCKTRLAIYETESFSVVKYIYDDDFNIALSDIEYSDKKSALFVVGFERNYNGMQNKYFVAKLSNDILSDYTEITKTQYDYITGYKCIERMGFTSKAKEWSSLKYQGYDLDGINNESMSIADYIKCAK